MPLRAVCALALALALLVPPAAARAQPSRPHAQPAAAQAQPAAAHVQPGAAHAQLQRVPPSDVTASGAVLWDPADGRVLHGKQAGVGRPMASTTKIMTVLLALEAGALDDTLVVSERAAAVGRIAGAASLGLSEGERLPVRSVLAGLMLRSGNDAAVAVAEHVAGTEDAFVALMNARADELGLETTHFVNASGLTDDPAHQASPRDLARLAEVAMGHGPFARWAGARTLDVRGLSPMTNRNELLFAYRGATGVKTGYTSLAGLCLVASARRDGRTLYAVVLDSEDSFGDAAALLDYGFAGFRRVEGPGRGETVTRYRWPGAGVALEALRPLGRTVPTRAARRVTLRAVLDPDLPRPVKEGARAGEAQLIVRGRIRARTPLVTSQPVPASRRTSPATDVGTAVQEAVRTLVRLRPVGLSRPRVH